MTAIPACFKQDNERTETGYQKGQTYLLGNALSCLVSAAQDKGGCLQAARSRPSASPSSYLSGKLQRFEGSGEKPGVIRNQNHSYSNTYSPNLKCAEQIQ